jgi:hypothetical protein
MLKVKIINGNYGYNDNGKITTIPLGETVDLADDEAQRLINLKVAELVTDDTDHKGSKKPVATGENGEENKTPSVNPTENKNGAEGEIEGDTEKGLPLGETQLRSMTNTELKKLAEDMGLDTSKMKKKEDFVSAIMANVEYFDNDDEAPPVATVEDPI